ATTLLDVSDCPGGQRRIAFELASRHSCALPDERDPLHHERPQLAGDPPPLGGNSLLNQLLSLSSKLRSPGFQLGYQPVPTTPSPSGETGQPQHRAQRQRGANDILQIKGSGVGP